jgi:uncharacterized protein (DUF1778 family)
LWNLCGYNPLMAGKPKDPDRVKTYTLRIRMTDEERSLIEAAAAFRSLETSTWARSELVALARKLLKQAGDKS